MFEYLLYIGVILLVVSIVLTIPGLILLILGWVQKDAMRKKAGLKMLAYAALSLLVSGTLCSSVVYLGELKL